MMIQEYRSIGHIDKTQWDRLTGSNPLGSHGWLQTVELTFIGNIQPLYITIEETKGRILAAATCYIADRGPILGDFDHMALGRLKIHARKFGISFMPLLVCCPLYAHGQHIFMIDTADKIQERAIVKAIVEKIENLALSLSLSLVFINIDRNEHQLMEQLTVKRFLRVKDLPQSVLDIDWRDFTGYLTFLKRCGRNIRKNVKKEMNRAKRLGVEIRPVKDPAAVSHRLHELLNSNCIRHNNVPFMFDRNFFSTLKEKMGKNAVIYGAYRDKDLNGVCIQLKSSTEGYLTLVGVDHAASGNDSSYFNLFFYVPIATAISTGLERLHYGRHMYAMKRKRGCRFTDTYFFYKPKNRFFGFLAAIWFKGLGWWNKRIGP